MATPDTEAVELAVGGYTFRGRVAGPEDGRLVLLLHGFPETSRSWDETMRTLAGDGYRAVAFDQRGYSPGARPEGVEHYTIDHLVNDVMAVADDVGGHRFDLVGHDWGGLVAWYVAGRHPDRVRSLAIAATPHPSAFRRGLAGELGGDQPQRSWYLDFFRRPEEPEQALLADGASGLRNIFTDVAPDIVEEYVRVLGEPGALTAALNYYRASDFGHLPDLPPCPVPTLYVWSSEDVAVARETAEATADGVSGPYRFEVLQGVSHWIPEQAGDAFAALLLEHLAASD